MRELLAVVQRVTVFLLIATLFFDLFSGTEYKKYFQYTAGLIVILMILAPVLDVLQKGIHPGKITYGEEIREQVERQEEKIMELEQSYERSVWGEENGD